MSLFNITIPTNETILQYAPGDAHRENIKIELNRQSRLKIEIPCIINGKEYRTGNIKKVVMPHAHQEVIAEFHLADEKLIQLAIDTSLSAKKNWEALNWSARAAVFLKAADLLAGPRRDLINAATMLGQSKNVYQAEIDSACELIDFLRFNAYFYQEILKGQPISGPGLWNQLEWRSLEGFIAAITPFNFTAIAGNLCATPAMLGNGVVWKPSDTQMLSAYYTYKLYEEAGLPPGVINFIPADGPLAGKILLSNKKLAGVHFTGSTETFQNIWKTVGEQIGQYNSYPRLVGETGGKDFVFVHPSADVDQVVTGLIRGAFEYQGQKCSAASRAYVPKSLWIKIKDLMISQMKELKMGDVRDFSNFINAVIDERAFKKISAYQKWANQESSVKVLSGGKSDASIGYFVEPTLVEVTDPKCKTMVDEIFGPFLSVYVYDDLKIKETLELCDSSSPYALTGAIFAKGRDDIEYLSRELRNSAGNFYINDKPTGAVVGQQPFGGARASGTNDKAGSPLNLYRWLSPRTIKENFVPPTAYTYPFLK